jgi:hypothetical protein
MGSCLIEGRIGDEEPQYFKTAVVLKCLKAFKAANLPAHLGASPPLEWFRTPQFKKGKRLFATSEASIKDRVLTYYQCPVDARE